MTAADGPGRAARRRRGAAAFHGGAAAEAAVAEHYARRGLVVVHKRLRTRWGELDLIARDGAAVVFVEVKKARSLEAAAWRLGRAQAERLLRAAQAFLDGEPGGSLTEARFDLALVDDLGRVRIVENAFGVDW